MTKILDGGAAFFRAGDRARLRAGCARWLGITAAGPDAAFEDYDDGRVGWNSDSDRHDLESGQAASIVATTNKEAA
jgi:hypothetical protein